MGEAIRGIGRDIKERIKELIKVHFINKLFLLSANKKIEYLGVALDKSLDKVKKYIGKNKILNKQVFIDMNGNTKLDGLISTFNVSSYPTFILINSGNKIIFRDSGSDEFERLVEYTNNRKL